MPSALRGLLHRIESVGHAPRSVQRQFIIAGGALRSQLHVGPWLLRAVLERGSASRAGVRWVCGGAAPVTRTLPTSTCRCGTTGGTHGPAHSRTSSSQSRAQCLCPTHCGRRQRRTVSASAWASASGRVRVLAAIRWASCGPSIRGEHPASELPHVPRGASGSPITGSAPGRAHSPRYRLALTSLCVCQRACGLRMRASDRRRRRRSPDDRGATGTVVNARPHPRLPACRVAPPCCRWQLSAPARVRRPRAQVADEVMKRQKAAAAAGAGDPVCTRVLPSVSTASGRDRVVLSESPPSSPRGSAPAAATADAPASPSRGHDRLQVAAFVLCGGRVLRAVS